MAQPPTSQQASQASVAEGGGQVQGGQGNGGRGQGGRGGGGRGRNGGGCGDGWNRQGDQGQGNQGSQEGGQGYGRPHFDWRNAICRHCGVVGHTIRFCQQRRNDELAGLTFTNMDGDIYDKFEQYIYPKVPGGVRQEAQRRAAAGSARPAMFRLWQEREDPLVRVGEVMGETEEVTQRLKAGTLKEEPIIVESDDKDSREVEKSSLTILEKMEDLLGKVGRYQQRLKELCDEAQEWKADLPRLFVYESRSGSASGQQGYPGVTTIGSGPRSGMTFRPPTPHGRGPQVAQTRSQSKAGPSRAPSQAPPRRRLESERRKEVVEVPEEEEEEDDDTEDERLRQEEDRQTELRAQRRGIREETEPSQQDSVPKKRKYAVRLEEGFDVERTVDRLLEGHNDLMNLKDIQASVPRLRDGLKERLSRRLAPNVHLNHGILHEGNCKAVFRGTTSNVIIEIGKVRARTCFFVMPDVDHPILLGRSFMCKMETLIFYKHDETMILLMSDQACWNYEVITCRNTGPESERNRPNPGSFTFVESENERQRLWEEPEEEGREEVLSLSLMDANKAMEIVAAHEMADPEAIKALREQVLERLQVGEVELIYRLPGGSGVDLSASRGKRSPCDGEDTNNKPTFFRGRFKQGAQRRYKTVDTKCQPVPVLVTEDEETYYEGERGLIRHVRSFLSTCEFWRSFVKNFAVKTERLRKLVYQDQKWVCGEDQEEAVTRMKGEFKEGGIVLGATNYEVTEEKPFVIETDVGPTALGGVLIQADAEGKERPLRFESRNLNATERNYFQFKKETLAVLHCLRIFWNYVFSRRFILRVDPTALACSLKNYTPSDPTVARWLTYIWMFNFELERISGDKNKVDGLSRVNWEKLDQE
ncbi:hypothetical protein CBR_g23000 [Chara braunii]|uniref:Reverse transcriptase RNase H-like domain-containing protein n=1 Tax=Chara braunii TaxID=69332 RepID=A0A388L3A0_CHABU|nr:hypothetical protein CBR_g23000 [Chara braunii]|eukprot:GBG76784.1 hypothetical protein CBR_g23000 [Chara braunii]